MLVRLWPFALTIAVLLIAYLPHVSPMIGMGPSGILTAALTSGGFGPAPNYPVHNLISRVFLLLPFERADYALNVLSLVSAVLAIAFMAQLARRIVEVYLGRTLHPVWNLAAGLGIGLLYFASPGLSRVSFFADRYTTEVLFLAVTGNIFLEAWLSLKPKWLIAMAHICGLIFFVHPKSLPFTWMLMVLLLYRTQLRIPVFKMVAAFVVGLWPLLWMVWVSSHDPLFDWANPDTLQGLINSIARKEYGGIQISRSWGEAWRDWIRQYTLLLQQFHPAVWSLLALGLGLLIRKAGGAIVVLCLLVLGEGTNVMQHFGNPQGTRVLEETANWYMLNYYPPYFVLWTWVAVVGVMLALPRRLNTLAMGLSASVVLVIVHLSITKTHSQKNYRLTDELLGNFERALPRGAVLFTNVDSLFAPLVYNQIHHGRLAQASVLNPELMLRSWYYRDIERLYPELWSSHSAQFERLRDYILAFEQSGFDEGKFRISEFIRMMNQLGDQLVDKGLYVHVDSELASLRPGLFHNLQWEPEALWLRLIRGSYRIQSLDLAQIELGELTRLLAAGDYWAQRFASSFVKVLSVRLKRAQLMESEEIEPVRSFVSRMQRHP